MNSVIRSSLEYFQPGVAKLNVGVPETEFDGAVTQLSAPLPPSMRAFLSFANGGRIAFAGIYGIAGKTNTDPKIDVVRQTLRWRRKIEGYQQMCSELGTVPPARIPRANLICIGDKDTGDVYVLLPDLVNGAGEYAVAQLDHETLEVMGIVASNYERFLWFLLQELQREVEPSGAERSETSIGDALWPFGNQSWILHHDPELAKWINA